MTMRLRKAVVVPYSAAAMFALADDIESYPDFVPWCAAAEAERDGEIVRAVLRVRCLGATASLKTRNRHRPPHRIDMRLEDGPLDFLEGHWQFDDIGQQRSRVEFNLDYKMAGGWLGRLFSPMFATAFGMFADCFAAQAKKRYGDIDPGKIRVAVADSSGEKELILPAGATVADALAAGGFDNPESAGVFGRECPPQTPLGHGDRVEVYQSLQNDPRARRRARAESEKELQP